MWLVWRWKSQNSKVNTSQHLLSWKVKVKLFHSWPFKASRGYICPCTTAKALGTMTYQVGLFAPGPSSYYCQCLFRGQAGWTGWWDWCMVARPCDCRHLQTAQQTGHGQDKATAVILHTLSRDLAANPTDSTHALLFTGHLPGCLPGSPEMALASVSEATALLAASCALSITSAICCCIRSNTSSVERAERPRRFLSFTPCFDLRLAPGNESVGLH